MNKVQHMVHHFKEQLYESMPARIEGDPLPYKCPEPGCKFETKHKPDWARHFGTVHKYVERYLARYLEEHSEAWANQPENRILMRENSPANQVRPGLVAAAAAPGGVQQGTVAGAAAVQRSPSMASAATSNNSDQLDVGEGLLCKIKELQQQQQQQQQQQNQQQPPPPVAVVSSASAAAGAPRSLNSQAVGGRLAAPQAASGEPGVTTAYGSPRGGMLLTTAANRLAVELPKSDLTQFITSALSEKNVPHAVDNGNHKKIILTTEQQVLEKKVST
jgi:hypothetical protein